MSSHANKSRSEYNPSGLGGSVKAGTTDDMLSQISQRIVPNEPTQSSPTHQAKTAQGQSLDLATNSAPNNLRNPALTPRPHHNDISQPSPVDQLNKHMQTVTKKKKINSDDCAALEAQNMLQVRSRRTKKPTKRA